jgi:demethylmenaquinone methyltransferase/2-methoxy-6-polyprenyl-1,4-benzoquinol methylase
VTNTNLAEYYAKRALEYDNIYNKPERQNDIKSLAKFLTDLLKKKSVLEVACGTGFWTRFYASETESITGVDYNEEVLAIARDRLKQFSNVSFCQSDAYLLNNFSGSYNAGIAHFWWSHVELDKLKSFLERFHSKLLPHSLVVFTDNKYVHGSSTPIARKDQSGNTYQNRKLENGDTYEVLKNFPSKAQFESIVNDFTDKVCFREFEFFWCGHYQLAQKIT